MKLLPYQNAEKFILEYKIKTRPNAGSGLWLLFLLPLSLIISAATQPIISTSTYKLSSIFSVGLICSSLVFLYQKSHEKRLLFLNVGHVVAWFVTAVLFRVCLHRGILFSIWSAGFSTVLYYKFYLLVLEKLQKCFTLGEAAVFSQGCILLLYFSLINIFNNTLKTATSVMQISTLIIQVGLVGIATIAILVFSLGVKDPIKVYGISLFVFLFNVLLPLQLVLQKNPLIWIMNLLWEDIIATNKVVLYWGICSILAVLVTRKKIQEAKKASTSTRKVFHILTVAVFIPGLLYNCSLLYLASGVTLGIFFVLEIVRILNVPPLGQHLQNGLVIFSDEKDVGIIALTPMYLLSGCALPLWIHPSPCDVTNSAIFSLLPLLSGLLTIGIGDTAASIVGSKFGKHHWRGSKKTIEGSFACIVSQLLVICALIYLDFLKWPSPLQQFKIVLAVVLTSLIEAKTDQVDNLVLPFVMYIILIF